MANKSSPYFVDWAVTAQCNMTCRHCRGFPKSDVSSQQARRLASEIAELKPGWVIIEGGEPLLREDIFELLERLRAGSLEVYLITNGMLASPEITRRLKELGVRVMVSLDGATPGTYEAIRSGASFERVLASARGYAAAGLLEALNFTILKANYHEIPAFFRLARDIGAPKLTLIGLKPCANYHEELVSPQEYDKIIRLTCRAAEATGVGFFFDEPFFQAVARDYGLTVSQPAEAAGIVAPETSGCAFGDYLFVEVNGDVKPCSYASLVLGNVNEKPLAAIWEEMRASPLIEKIKDPKTRTGACRSCRYLAECKGCRSRVFALTGDWFGPDVTCPLYPEEAVKEAIK